MTTITRRVPRIFTRYSIIIINTLRACFATDVFQLYRFQNVIFVRVNLRCSNTIRLLLYIMITCLHHRSGSASRRRRRPRDPLRERRSRAHRVVTDMVFGWCERRVDQTDTGWSFDLSNVDGTVENRREIAARGIFVLTYLRPTVSCSVNDEVRWSSMRVGATVELCGKRTRARTAN